MDESTGRGGLALGLGERLEAPPDEREPSGHAAEDDDADGGRGRPSGRRPWRISSCFGRHVPHAADEMMRARQADAGAGDLVEARHAESR